MAHLVYTRTMRGAPSPQVIHDSGAKPFIDAGIRGRLWPGEPRAITAAEEAALLGGALSLKELAERYQPEPIATRIDTKIVLPGTA